MFGCRIVDPFPLARPTHAASTEVEYIIYFFSLRVCTTGKTVNIRVRLELHYCEETANQGKSARSTVVIGEWGGQMT